MKYNFDELIERRGTHAIKYDAMQELWGRTDLIPMWVADMDFRTPPFILDALRRRMEHEIFGYTAPGDSYFRSIIEWVGRRYGMTARQEDIHYIPGIVPGIHHALCALSEKGDKIMIQPPVYHPFRQVIEGTGRVPVCSPLTLHEGRFRMDFDRMAHDLKGCKLFILCNPVFYNFNCILKISRSIYAVSQQCFSNLKLKNFHGLSVSSWVDVHYTQGNTYKVVAKGTPLAFETNEISVNNGILTVDQNRKKRNQDEGVKMTIYVTSPKMDYIENSGSTTFSAGQFNAGDMKIDNSGVLRLNAGGISSTSVNLENSGSLKGSSSFSGGSMKYDNTGVCALTGNFDLTSFSYDNSGSSKISGKVKAGNMTIDNTGVIKDELDIESNTLSMDISGSSSGSIKFKGHSLDIDCSGVGKMTLNVDCDKLTSDTSGSLRLKVAGRADNTEFNGSGVSKIDTSGLNNF